MLVSCTAYSSTLKVEATSVFVLEIILICMHNWMQGAALSKGDIRLEGHVTDLYVRLLLLNNF
jgi:hypothetical protein